MNKLAIPGAIVVAGLLIAGAVVYSTTAGSGTTGGQTTAIAASDLQYDSSEFQSLMDEVGVNGKTLGSENAPITLVEYSDTECPYCNRFHGTMKQAMREYGTNGQLAWTFRHFPIEQLHSKAPKEARALECINEAGGARAFWTGLDTLFEITPGDDGLDHDKLPAIAERAGVDRSTFNECLASDKHQDTVQSEIEQARAAGGNGTPFSVITLNEPIDQTTRQEIEQVDQQISGQQQLFQIAGGGQEIKMSGALPYGVLQQLFNAILGEDTPSAGNDGSTDDES